MANGHFAFAAVALLSLSEIAWGQQLDAVSLMQYAPAASEVGVGGPRKDLAVASNAAIRLQKLQAEAEEKAKEMENLQRSIEAAKQAEAEAREQAASAVEKAKQSKREQLERVKLIVESTSEEELQQELKRRRQRRMTEAKQSIQENKRLEVDKRLLKDVSASVASTVGQGVKGAVAKVSTWAASKVKDIQENQPDQDTVLENRKKAKDAALLKYQERQERQQRMKEEKRARREEKQTSEEAAAQATPDTPESVYQKRRAAKAAQLRKWQEKHGALPTSD
mmetsp:Transcript_27562/g.62731  ORF Transcript_27562/g.62731 Transcript_27562/m.62731 type:complete len:280 (-) Transcript_27562:149-988(-)